MKDTQASSTAFFVIQGILYTAQSGKFPNLVPQDMADACEKILSNSERGRERLKLLDSFWFKRLVPVFEKLIMQGVTLHFVLRKRCIEDYTIQAIEKGVTQVINLGAGFDTLAYRLCKRYPQVNFIEIDHPATLAVKVKSLQQDDLAQHLTFIPVDFTTQTFEEALRKSTAFLPDKSTLFISEGVLPYLRESEVGQLLESLKRLTGKNTQFILTCVEPVSAERNSHGVLLNVYLKIKGEPLLWLKKSADLGDFLEQYDFTLKNVIMPEELVDRYLQNYQGIVHKNEYIAIATYA